MDFVITTCDNCNEDYVVSKNDEMAPSYNSCTNDYTFSYLNVYCPLCKRGWVRMFGPEAASIADKLKLDSVEFASNPGVANARFQWMARHSTTALKLARDMEAAPSQKEAAIAFYSVLENI